MDELMNNILLDLYKKSMGTALLGIGATGKFNLEDEAYVINNTLGYIELPLNILKDGPFTESLTCISPDNAIKENRLMRLTQNSSAEEYSDAVQFINSIFSTTSNGIVSFTPIAPAIEINKGSSMGSIAFMMQLVYDGFHSNENCIQFRAMTTSSDGSMELNYIRILYHNNTWLFNNWKFDEILWHPQTQLSLYYIIPSEGEFFTVNYDATLPVDPVE